MDGLVKQCSKMSSLKVFTYGAGNFASQLSWTMVSTYLALFYTDVLGLEAASVALLLLLAKTIDALCDPVLGAIMERTDTLVVNACLLKINISAYHINNIKFTLDIANEV